MTRLLFDTEIKDWRIERIEKHYSRTDWAVGLRFGPLLLLRTVKRRRT